MRNWRSDDSGFTLIEALAALTIVAAGLAVIGQLGFGAVLAARRTQARFVMTSAARAAFAALPDGAALEAGEIDGVAWRLRASPYPLAKPPQGLWVPQAVRLEVAAPGGGTLVLDTVALRPLSGP